MEGDVHQDAAGRGDSLHRTTSLVYSDRAWGCERFVELLMLGPAAASPLDLESRLKDIPAREITISSPYGRLVWCLLALFGSVLLAHGAQANITPTWHREHR